MCAALSSEMWRSLTRFDIIGQKRQEIREDFGRIADHQLNAVYAVCGGARISRFQPFILPDDHQASQTMTEPGT